FTLRIVGFGVHAGTIDGVTLCRMFRGAIRRASPIPKYLSSDHDPLYRFQRWQANLRVVGVAEIKTVPYVPLSHPFVERMIGTVRREFLDHVLFWNTADLDMKLRNFQDYYNSYRTHTGRAGNVPVPENGPGRLAKMGFLSLATALWRLISNPYGRVTATDGCGMAKSRSRALLQRCSPASG